MTKTFLISDTHFGHDNAYKFVDSKGERIRPWATNALDGDEVMVERWNSVVGPKDRVYHLGDVAIPRRGLKVLAQLNGRKKLIRGNHDVFKISDYVTYFDDIHGSIKLYDYFLTHIPIHPDSIPSWCKANLHGHLHINRVMARRFGPMWWSDAIDERYQSFCVENINATPVDFDEFHESMQA